MCDQQRLRTACAYTQSDQSLCKSLEYSMSIKLLTEHHLEFLTLQEATQARLNLHLSKCHIVGNHMSRLISIFPRFFLQLGVQHCNDVPTIDHVLVNSTGLQNAEHFFVIN